ncbi:ABC transporter substrate-binding protein [Novosphingobium sp. PP1Y]|uniref:ABC transporter substrate-binding protein n=1 Tax=Novosphingobium sp. PP1Y TaxID=702113 RepID=UPI0002FC61A7|nr:ABC transporter substrate-binding protein [Novosphingobium sp. PP1Y]
MLIGGNSLSRRSVIGAGLAGAGLLALGGCAGGERKATPKKGGSIRVATQAASTADTLDPAKGALATDYTRHFMLYNGLTCIEDESLVPRPSLAKSIDSADRITWHFELERGVRFHDGSELTAQDVVFSLLRHKDPAVGSKMETIAAQFADVRSDGRYGVTIRLTGANADLPTILAQSHFLVVRAGQNAPDGNGTGAFRLAEFQPGVRTVVVRNEEYWIPGRPHLERVELIAIPDEVSRVNALLSGDIQLCNAINPRSTRRIEADPRYATMATPSALFTDLIMRQDQLPTGNPDFVQAVKLMIDRPLIKRALFRNYATIANDQPIAPFQPYFNPDVPQTVLDLDKARWHIQRSGLTGVRMPIFAATAAEGSVDMASILQEYGSKVGLNFAVNRVPADGYWSTHWMRHPMTFGNCNPRPTADLIFSLFFDSKANWNESGWKNERFDRLLIEARGEADEARRAELYGEMQRIVHDKCGVAIPVFISLLDGHDRRLKGLVPVPLGAFMGYRFAEYAWWED